MAVDEEDMPLIYNLPGLYRAPDTVHSYLFALCVCWKPIYPRLTS